MTHDDAVDPVPQMTATIQVSRHDCKTGVPRLYVLGASCSGVSTLGARLSDRLDVPLLDVDAFYWMPTDPPFTTKRPPKDRVSLIEMHQAKTPGWILAGSLVGWGDALVTDADLIVFIYTPTPVRMQRLARREAQRHGARIQPGGDMHDDHLAFRNWAAGYDVPGFAGRSLAEHERWIAAQSLPVIRLDGEQETEVLAQTVMHARRRAVPLK